MTAARPRRPAAVPGDEPLTLGPTTPGTIRLTGPDHGPGTFPSVTFGTIGATGPAGPAIVITAGPAIVITADAIVITDDMSEDLDPDTDPGIAERVTVAHAARLTDRHPELIRRWIREGVLPARKVGRGIRARWMIRRVDLDALMERERRVTTGGLPPGDPRRVVVRRRRRGSIQPKGAE